MEQGKQNQEENESENGGPEVQDGKKRYTDVLYIFENKMYKLDTLELFGIPISPCPQSCDSIGFLGVRFQANPQADCKGMRTCFYGERIWGSLLLRMIHGKAIQCCCQCQNYFVRPGYPISKDPETVFCSHSCMDKYEGTKICYYCRKEFKASDAILLDVTWSKRDQAQSGEYGYRTQKECFCSRKCISNFKRHI